MTPARPEEDPPAAPRIRGDGARIVYDRLKAEILSLELPPGQHLDETALARRFDMSRSPVREAMIRLAGEGLLVTLSNRSTQVAPLDLLRFPQYIAALDLLQRANTRLAARNRSAADLVTIHRQMLAFEAAVRSNDYLAMSETNLHFHVAVARAGGNPYLIQPYERLLNEGRRMLHLHFDYLARTAGDEALLTDEHAQILAAITEGDADRADRLAHAHTRQFRDRFLQYLLDNPMAGIDLTASLQP